jgi:hypothetical protein
MKIIAIIILALLLIGAGAYIYLFRTNSGLEKAADYAFSHFIHAEHKSFGQIKGRLSQAVILEDVELKNVEGFPQSTIRIQELTLTPHGLNFNNVGVKVMNARLVFPSSDPIVINGVLDNQQFDLTIFSSVVDVGDILKAANVKSDIQGGIKAVDLHVQGTLKAPRIQGTFMIDRLVREDYVLSQSPGDVDLEIKNNPQGIKLKGHVGIKKGHLKSKRTELTLKRSTLYFKKKPDNPDLSLRGFSIIGETEIDVLVKGTMEKPDLQLTSDPPLGPEILMVMLATGREWAGIENLEKGSVSPEVAKQFVGYLFFSGSGEGFLDRMGISDVKVTMEENKKGLGFKKEITDDLDFDYGVEQSTLSGQMQTSQTVGMDYRISNKFFASVERQMPADGSDTNDAPRIDSRLLLKYKRRF